MSKNLKNILIFGFIVKILLGLYLPVTLDEYYYFLWGQYPSLSYFDHPPMTGWLMILSQPMTFLLEGGLRVPFIVLSHLTVILWILILKNQISERRLQLFTAIALLNPLWGMGGIIATPDIPLVFFWSLALYFCSQLIKQNQLANYLGLGAALGLAFLSKYQIVVFLPCLILLIWQQSMWKKLFSPKTILAVVVAFIFCSPVIWWNYQNEWASFNFQWKHGMTSRYWKWYLPLEYLGSQIGILFPTFLFFLGTSWKKTKEHWLTPFAFFPFVFFLYSSFKSRVEGNWVIMALPSFYALSISLTPDHLLHWLRKTVFLWGSLLVIAVAGIQYLPKNKLTEAKKFDIIYENMDSSKTYLSNSYQLSGFLSFKMKKTVCKLPKYGRMDHMDFFKTCQELPDHFYYVTELTHGPKIEEDFAGYKVIADHPINERFKFIEVKKQ